MLMRAFVFMNIIKFEDKVSRVLEIQDLPKPLTDTAAATDVKCWYRSRQTLTRKLYCCTLESPEFVGHVGGTLSFRALDTHSGAVIATSVSDAWMMATIGVATVGVQRNLMELISISISSSSKHVLVLKSAPKAQGDVLPLTIGASMEDYILGVSNPQQWHSENLKMNRAHYSSWMASLGGAKLITKAADQIGVGVHFNPFVSWNDKMYKYGVVCMNDLLEDMLSWKRFYLSGRLQKPVRIIVDNMEITNANLINLRAASSAALLLLPSKFTEMELYAKICGLSYMGDLRMLFAEDKTKVKKIVEGQFELIRNMYKPLIDDYSSKQLLSLSSCGYHQMNMSQDCSLSATSSIVSSLPESVRSQMGLGKAVLEGQISKFTIGSREEAAALMQKVLRRRVMISSARQAVAGFITAGAVHGIKYLGKKMMKAWKSSGK
ncbi:hypothetical protein E3N88_37325 [Mikania micrantha]|uniref:Phosphatidate cytidylyltransferase, mitochondrial n=1 Tax=Mikania micrantha TaxID=192012 RepID=A0A5N6LQV4_9ASTR|nr:hypothetical protein E3N88_37325 [Mikania micrantha]